MRERSNTRGARRKKMIAEDVKWLESSNACAKRNANALSFISPPTLLLTYITPPSSLFFTA